MKFLLLSFLGFLILNVCLCAEWDGLKVTWTLNPFNTWGFDSLPRHVKDLTNDFSLRDDQCSLGDNAKFLGKRYWYKNDSAVILLFDKNGFIAGIQTAAPKDKLNPSAYLKEHRYVDDGDFWTLTAYFVDPTKICGEGRTQQAFEQQGTGTGLWLQSGANPLRDYQKIPDTEDEMRKTNWVFGKCFYTMGNHYWYNVTKGMDCGNFMPNCILYNSGRLTAFCFAINAQLPSKRYEHPTVKVTNKFLNPVPDCFYTDATYETLSTMHVYFKNSPRLSSRC